MKKLFYTLSAAVVLGLTASAATPQMSQMQVKSVSQSQMQISKLQPGTKLTATGETKENKARKVGRQASAEDFIGNWEWTSDNMLEGSVLPSSGTLTIAADKANPSMLNIDGFLSGITLNGYIQNGTLVIPNQKLFDDEGDEAWFWNFYLQEAEVQGDIRYFEFIQGDSTTPFYLSITEDGGLWAGDPLLMGDGVLGTLTDEQLKTMTCNLGVIPLRAHAQDPLLFYMLNAWVQGRPLDTFKFDESEWSYIGDSEFKDAWFKGMWADQGYDPAVYYVPTYVNNDNANVFLLYDVYGAETPYRTVNVDPDRTGYLVFSVTNPDCVVFQPLVYSITTDDYVIGGAGDGTVAFYNYNLEGYYNIIEGVDTDEIAMAFDMQGVPCSTFDPTDGFVDIQNGVFSMEAYNLLEYATWDTPLFDMSGYILLPEGWDSGVEGIVGENENAPVEYYNLMGVKVNNPAKGQLVIVRKGNKAYKTFAK